MFLWTDDLIMNYESNGANNSGLKDEAKLTWSQKSKGLVGEIENREMEVFAHFHPIPKPQTLTLNIWGGSYWARFFWSWK